MEQYINPNKLNPKHKKKRNTTNFKPDHRQPHLRVKVAYPQSITYEDKFMSNDVVLVNHLFNDNSIYQKLLDELKQAMKELYPNNNHNVWKLWHGDTHFIADDHLNWKEKCPYFNEIVDKACSYFKMQPKATRMNWYKNSKEWKPFHHDAAAVDKRKAKTQNLTIGISFGATREIAFENNYSKTRIAFPMNDCFVYAFGKDVNIKWKHGIPQLPPNKQNNSGRISIIIWGKNDQSYK
ncbi:MAG: hypothetical protein CMF62_03820 [Magnetococcales bacterium]|nr:hypothetical protein [Magnetococcales bacterium]|tara:strand:+ start:36131 stop:36841 length:711 start_codon:yes stop_codon:yes gene_type:complete